MPALKSPWRSRNRAPSTNGAGFNGVVAGTRWPLTSRARCRASAPRRRSRRCPHALRQGTLRQLNTESRWNSGQPQEVRHHRRATATEPSADAQRSRRRRQNRADTVCRRAVLVAEGDTGIVDVELVVSPTGTLMTSLSFADPRLVECCSTGRSTSESGCTASRPWRCFGPGSNGWKVIPAELSVESGFTLRSGRVGGEGAS